MDDMQGRRRLVVAHISYAYLIFGAALHVMTAYGLSLFISEIAKINPIYAFAVAYMGLVSLTSYLVFRNGRWAVDDEFIYKGWRLAPFIAVSEIEYAAIGLPDTLFVALSGNRRMFWHFRGMVNGEQFILAVLDVSPQNYEGPMRNVVIGMHSLTKVGKILQG